MAYKYFNKINREWIAQVEPKPLHDKHLKNSRIVPNRNAILDYMPKGGKCIEVGTYKGDFAKHIQKVLQPSQFFILDRDFSSFDEPYFKAAIDAGSVKLLTGDSSTIMESFEDAFFDFIYIDGDHSYQGVKKDIDVARRKVKSDGWIVCNDYTVYSSLNDTRFGICKAAHELCLEHDWEIVYLGLQTLGFHDIALRKITNK